MTPDGWVPMRAEGHEKGFPTHEAAHRVGRYWQALLDLRRRIRHDTVDFEWQVVGVPGQ